MNFRILLPGVLTLMAAPGTLAETSVWSCAVERRIENGRTDFFKPGPAQPMLILAINEPAGRGCVLATAADTSCSASFTNISRVNDVLRMDRIGEDGRLDLINIFEASGRFIRIHGTIQWMGAQRACVRRNAPSVAIR